MGKGRTGVWLSGMGLVWWTVCDFTGRASKVLGSRREVWTDVSAGLDNQAAQGAAQLSQSDESSISPGRNPTTPMPHFPRMTHLA